MGHYLVYIYIKGHVVSCLPLWKLDTVIRVQNLDDAVCISRKANTLGKGMNPNIVPLVMGKMEGRLNYFILVRQTIKEKEDSEFQPFKLRLKNRPHITLAV